MCTPVLGTVLQVLQVQLTPVDKEALKSQHVNKRPLNYVGMMVDGIRYTVWRRVWTHGRGTEDITLDAVKSNDAQSKHSAR